MAIGLHEGAGRLIVLIVAAFFLGCIAWSSFRAWSIARLVDQARWQIKEEVASLRHDFVQNRQEFMQKVLGEPALPSDNNASRNYARLVQHTRNAIVQVFAERQEFNWLEPYRSPRNEVARGSGFFIDENAYLLTNFHVVGDSIRVQIQNSALGKERYTCRVVGVCPERDLALLQVDEEGRKKIVELLGEIKFLPLGDSDSLSRGSELMALGFPLGQENLKGTQGIISGWEELPLGNRGGSLSCLQITNAINPGNSGGPSVNLQGEVVGINFAGIGEAQNVGYVLPINELKSAIHDLHTNRLLRKPRLNCMLHSSCTALTQYLKNPERGGYYLAKVFKHSLAERIGLQEGDVLYEINGYLIDSFGDTVVPWREDRVSCISILNRLEVDEEVSLVLYRQGQRKELTFSFKDENYLPAIRVLYPGYEQIDYELFGGMVVMELSLNLVMILCEQAPLMAKYLYPENQDESVLVVTHVQPSSPVANLRGVLAAGSVLDKVNGCSVKNLAELRHELNNSLAHEFITFKTSSCGMAALSIADVLKNELKLAKAFRYSPKHSVALAHALTHNR